jgi:hypothetical protein
MIAMITVPARLRCWRVLSLLRIGVDAPSSACVRLYRIARPSVGPYCVSEFTTAGSRGSVTAPTGDTDEYGRAVEESSRSPGHRVDARCELQPSRRSQVPQGRIEVLMPHEGLDRTQIHPCT